MHILIVDDSRAMRRIVLRAIRQAGYSGHDFHEAENGKLGLEAVEEHSPDLILSDWNMPEMTGIEFLREVRGSGNDVPFGFITTEGTAELRKEATEAGANFLLQKPFTPDQIEETLSQFVD